MYKYFYLYCISNKYVLNELRQRYWILKGLVIVQKILLSCSLCCRLRVKFESFVMVDLFDLRLGYQQLFFVNIRVDYFGFIFVRYGRKIEKYYSVFFTCLIIWAVYFEIVYSLDIDFCLMVIRRIMVRCRRLVNIWLYNGINFVRIEKEFREVFKYLDSERIGDQLFDEGV